MMRFKKEALQLLLEVSDPKYNTWNEKAVRKKIFRRMPDANGIFVSELMAHGRAFWHERFKDRQGI